MTDIIIGGVKISGQWTSVGMTYPGRIYRESHNIFMRIENRFNLLNPVGIESRYVLVASIPDEKNTVDESMWDAESVWGEDEDIPKMLQAAGRPDLAAQVAAILLRGLQ